MAEGVRHYMEDPLKRKAAMAKQATKMQLTVQERSDAELATLKDQFGENPKEALENLYVTQGLSIKRIAEMHKVSEYILKKWFKKFEIQTKDGDGAKRLDIFNRARTLGILTVLEDRERQILEYHYKEGKILTEIAGELGIAIDAVKYIQKKALSKLTRQLVLSSSSDK